MAGHERAALGRGGGRRGDGRAYSPLPIVLNDIASRPKSRLSALRWLPTPPSGQRLAVDWPVRWVPFGAAMWGTRQAGAPEHHRPPHFQYRSRSGSRGPCGCGWGWGKPNCTGPRRGGKRGAGKWVPHLRYTTRPTWPALGPGPAPPAYRKPLPGQSPFPSLTVVVDHTSRYRDGGR